MRLGLWTAGLLAAAWVLGHVSTLVAVAVIVGIVTFPIYPLVDWLECRLRLSRGTAAALTVLAVLLVVVLGVVSVIPWVVAQGQVLIAIAPQGIQVVAAFLSKVEERFADPAVPQFLRTAVERAGEAALGAANAFASRMVSTLVGWFGRLYLVLLLPFIIYFVLLDYRSSREAILSLIAEPTRSRVERLLANLTLTLRWGLWAQVVVSGVVGALTAVGLGIVGVPGSIAIGVFGGIAEAIPYIGGFATYAVALLAAAPAGGTVWMWAMVVVTVVKLLANILVPLVLGRMTQTHPLAIIAALLVLGQLFGVLGMFFAVPAVVVVREVIAWWREASEASQA
jgi:predicted PurR-regulated permease PerM